MLWMTLFVATAAAVSVVPLVAVWRAKRHGGLAVRTLSDQARKIPATPPSKLVEGSLARVIGTVLPSGPWLVAPFSKTPCAYWRFRIRALVYAPHASWRDVFDDEEGCRFVLEHGKERCLVLPIEIDGPGGGRVCADMPRTARLRVDPRTLPAAVADVLDRYTVELPLAPLVIEEYALAIDGEVGVAGIVTRVEDPAAAESDYRSGRPTVAAFDASAGDLLLSTDRHLRTTRATLVATSTADRAWGLPDVDAQGKPIASLAAFEAELERNQIQRRTIAGVVAAVIVMGAIGVALSSLAHTTTPRLTGPHRELIVDELDRSRARLAGSQVDRAWRDAMAHRREDRAADAPCPASAWLEHRFAQTWRGHGDGMRATPIAQAVVGPGEQLGPTSPRTHDALATLEVVTGFVERGVGFDADGNDLVDDARLTHLDRYDLVVDRELDHHDHDVHLRGYLYDHEAERIVCIGESIGSVSDTHDVLPVYAALRAVYK